MARLEPASSIIASHSARDLTLSMMSRMTRVKWLSVDCASTPMYFPFVSGRRFRDPAPVAQIVDDPLRIEHLIVVAVRKQVVDQLVAGERRALLFRPWHAGRRNPDDLGTARQDAADRSPR